MPDQINTPAYPRPKVCYVQTLQGCWCHRWIIIPRARISLGKRQQKTLRAAATATALASACGRAPWCCAVLTRPAHYGASDTRPPSPLNGVHAVRPLVVVCALMFTSSVVTCKLAKETARVCAQCVWQGRHTLARPSSSPPRRQSLRAQKTKARKGSGVLLRLGS